MKKVIIFILGFLIIQYSFGQVATIQDSDGWTNVRKEPTANSEIILKLYENEVFWFDYEPTDKEQDWILVRIPKNKFSLGQNEPDLITGFIHKSRLLPIEKMEKYSGKDFLFKYEFSNFDSTNRIVDKQDGKWVIAIDGRPVWGTDGDVPNTIVNNIIVKIENKNITIHKVFYSDIYEVNDRFEVYKNGQTYFVYQWNSDGAGFYEIVWVLDKNGLQQRLVGAIF